jgi:lysophospholipid acyltransferase (LPLAT)-like uncharacterized protein
MRAPATFLPGDRRCTTDAPRRFPVLIKQVPMSEQTANKDYSDVEARRSTASRRRMSAGRRLYYFVGLPLLKGLVRLLWRSYRVEKLIGAEIAERIVTDGKVYAPCYWHQQHVLCTKLMRGWIKRGFKATFLISSSVDGEVPARIARAWGAEVIRGSANQTGTLVLRDMQEAFRRGVSIVVTADGPNGPQHEFKIGTVLMARIAGVPMVPVACAADRAWYLDRWDAFMIPKPFARVVLAVGEPVVVPANTPLNQLERYRAGMEDAIMSLMDQSQNELARRETPHAR